MHSNISSTLLLIAVPAMLVILIGLIQWLVKKRFPKRTMIFAAVLLLLPGLFITAHFMDQKKEMKKRAGIFKPVISDHFHDMCFGPDDLALTIRANGTYSFNHKPCFSDRLEGKWSWEDNMVGEHADFDMKVPGTGYLDFDDPDTIRILGFTDTLLMAKVKLPE